MQDAKVIVIGAGIGGLAAAYWLCQRGFGVEVLEASSRPGGRMLTLERKGDRIDVGAQFYHTNFTYAFQLMDAVNLSDTRRLIGGKVQFALSDGSTYLYDHRMPYMKLLGLRGNLKLASFIVKYVLFGHRFPAYRIVRDIPEYDNVPATEIWPAPADASIRDYILTTMGVAETGGMPEWMSLYHYIHALRSTMFSSFFSLTGGVASLADELAKRLPVQYEAPVRQLVVEKGRVVGVEMEDGSAKKADHVMVAVAPPAAARLLPDELEAQRTFFESVVGTPKPMPVFFLDRPLKKDVWCYFSEPGLRRPFMFALDGSSKAPEMVPSGKSVLTAWSGYPMTAKLMAMSDQDIMKQALEDIELMIPGVSNYVEDTALVRHPYEMALFPPGSYRRVLDFQKQARELDGVSFVSDVLCTFAMEGAAASAAAAVNRVSQWGGLARGSAAVQVVPIDR
jgi:protoporphyrinogen oxidase